MGRFGSPSPARERRTASAIGRHRVVLADDPLVQVHLELEKPFPLLLGELRDRDAGRAGDDLGDVGRADLGHVLLGGLVAITVGGAVHPIGQLGDLVPQRPRPVVVLRRDGLVLLPVQLVKALLELAPVLGRPLGPQPDPGAGLVDEVDRLVGQEPVGNVPVGQFARPPPAPRW